jgi:RNase P/RNase MRP subunit POP5
MVTDPSYLLKAASLNYAISHSDFTEFYNWMTVHKVLGRMWKEEVEPWLKVLCRNFSGGTEKNHEKPSVRTVGISGNIRNVKPAKSKSRALSIERSCFVAEVTYDAPVMSD